MLPLSPLKEVNIDKKLAEVVKTLNGLYIKFIPAGFAGFPDRIILLPGARIHFAELKRPGKKPRKLQAIVHRTLAKLGFPVLVIDNLETINTLKIKWTNEQNQD